MNVVLDTNVIISAAKTPKGNCAKIVEVVSAQKGVQLYYAREILSEYKDVLNRPKSEIDRRKRRAMFKRVKDAGKLISPASSTIELPDESDRIFYDTAKASNAILVTGNIKHFPQEQYIMTPTEFLTELSKLYKLS